MTSPDLDNVPNNGIIYKNSFYESLQQAIDEHKNIPFLPNASIDIKDQSRTGINCSGNVKLSATINVNPNVAPNYSEAIINGNISTPGSIKILLDTILSENFVANPTTERLVDSPPPTGNYSKYTYVTNSSKESLHDMITKSKENPFGCWNLNFNRNLDTTITKAIAAHVCTKLNSVIDYVITNDLTEPDETFRKLVKEIFANEAGVYNFSHYTLMLPALVNYVASNSIEDKTTQNPKIGNPSNFHANRYTGIVKSGSGLFPNQNNIDVKKLDKWVPSGQTITAKTICPLAVLYNSTPQSGVGAYNYPFTAENIKIGMKPLLVDVKSNAADPVIKNIISKMKFKTDLYPYKDPINEIIATTGKNSDKTDRKEPTQTKTARKLNWETDFTSHIFYMPHAVKTPKLKEIDCTKKWLQI